MLPEEPILQESCIFKSYLKNPGKDEGSENYKRKEL